MSGTMNLLIGLAMGFSLVALASSRLPSVIRAAAFQGMILGTLPLLLEEKFHWLVVAVAIYAIAKQVDVRLALKWSLDRAALVNTGVFGFGIPGNDNPIAPQTKFAINPEPVHKYDPEKVRFHLKKAGLSSLKVDFSTSDAAFATAVDTALLMKDQAGKAGIDINVIREPADGY